MGIIFKCMFRSKEREREGRGMERWRGKGRKVWTFIFLYSNLIFAVLINMDFTFRVSGWKRHGMGVGLLRCLACIQNIFFCCVSYTKNGMTVTGENLEICVFDGY